MAIERTAVGLRWKERPQHRIMYHISQQKAKKPMTTSLKALKELHIGLDTGVNFVDDFTNGFF